MRSRGLGDGEVVALLRESPELLAIADAIAATQAALERRPRAGWLRLAAVAAVVAVAAVLALAAPWEGRGGGFTQRALAALGSGQVIHVLSESEVPDVVVVDLASGVETPVVRSRELWFDESRGLERLVERQDGAVMLDELQTPDGIWTEGGRVYTCAWIAAHPVAATRARVSCNANMQNGTVPRRIAEPRPSLDPTLAGFVSGYREALADGTAARDGSGEVDGRTVEWLRFESETGTPRTADRGVRVERVAVDAATLKPVLVETRVDGELQSTTRISQVETIGADGVDFSRPKLVSPGSSPVTTRGRDGKPASVVAAAAALGGRVVTAGVAVGGLDLEKLTVSEITTGFGRGFPRVHSRGVEVFYGTTEQWWNAAGEFVILRESSRPETLYSFVGPFAQAPPEGSVRVMPRFSSVAAPGGGRAETELKRWRGQLRMEGIYVTIDASSKELLLETARSLRAAG